MEGQGWRKAWWDGESLLMGTEFLFVIVGQHLVPSLEAEGSFWNSSLTEE